MSESKQWQRRQGTRAPHSGWTWYSWKDCTEAEAQRVSGLQSWQVRQVRVCSSCGGTGRCPVDYSTAQAPQPVAIRVREIFPQGAGRWRYFDFDPTMDLNRPNEEVEVLTSAEPAQPVAAPAQAVADAASLIDRKAADALIDAIAEEWDGCVYDAGSSGDIDIGEAIRTAWRRRSAQAAPAQAVSGREQAPAGMKWLCVRCGEVHAWRYDSGECATPTCHSVNLRLVCGNCHGAGSSSTPFTLLQWSTDDQGRHTALIAGRVFEHREALQLRDELVRLLDPVAAADTSASDAAPSPAPKLTVWFGPMPESNGKANWTAILHRGDLSEGVTLERSEHHERVRYEADRVRYLLGELPTEPFILDYDGDMLWPAGYVHPTTGLSAPPAPAARGAGDTMAEAALPAITWPKEKRVGRMGDMAPLGKSILTVCLDSDNDVCVEVWDDERGEMQRAAIEFCNGGGGGGQSPRTRNALINLMSAIEADNAAAPHKAHPPASRARQLTQAASKADAPAEADTEPLAKAVYDGWKDQPGWVPWVEGGNSHKQQEARRIARDQASKADAGGA